jgi:DNA-binding MarR family transcriptional regulator
MSPRAATADRASAAGGDHAADAAYGASADAGSHVGGAGASSADAAIADLERIAIGAVGVTTRALEQAAPGVDLTFSQWRALLILGEPDNGMRVGELAARVGVTLPATSRLLRRLERRDLVDLTPDETDRRATRARLAARGHEVRDAILAFRRAALGEIAEASGAGRRPASGRAIRALATSFERYT